MPFPHSSYPGPATPPCSIPQTREQSACTTPSLLGFSECSLTICGCPTSQMPLPTGALSPGNAPFQLGLDALEFHSKCSTLSDSFRYSFLPCSIASTSSCAMLFQLNFGECSCFTGVPPWNHQYPCLQMPHLPVQATRTLPPEAWSLIYPHLQPPAHYLFQTTQFIRVHNPTIKPI